jgi:hypothetical protein
MGYEPEIPPVPTRPQEVDYIERLADNFRDQPYSKYYSLEYFRQNKMEQAERINRYQKNWYSNFAIGLVVSGTASLALFGLKARKGSGIPWTFRPKMYDTVFRPYAYELFHYHVGVRQVLLSVGGAWWFANRYTDQEQLLDEYYDNGKVILPVEFQN